MIERITKTMNPNEKAQSNKLWVFVLKAAVLGAVLATVLSAFSFTGIGALAALSTRSPQLETAPTPWDIAKTTLLLCPIAVVWWGPFGFFLGAIQAVVLHLRRHRIRTLTRLLTESTVGLLLTIVLLYALSISHVLYPIPYPFLFLPTLILTTIICAIAFRNRFLQKS